MKLYPVLRDICPDYLLLFHVVVFFLSECFSCGSWRCWWLKPPSSVAAPLRRLQLSSLWRSTIFTSNWQIIIIRHFQINFTRRPDCNSDTFSLVCTIFCLFFSEISRSLVVPRDPSNDRNRCARWGGAQVKKRVVFLEHFTPQKMNFPHSPCFLFLPLSSGGSLPGHTKQTDPAACCLPSAGTWTPSRSCPRPEPWTRARWTWGARPAAPWRCVSVWLRAPQLSLCSAPCVRHTEEEAEEEEAPVVEGRERSRDATHAAALLCVIAAPHSERSAQWTPVKHRHETVSCFLVFTFKKNISFKCVWNRINNLNKL